MVFLEILCLRADKSLQGIFILIFYSLLLYLTFAIMAKLTKDTLFIPVATMLLHLFSKPKLKLNYNYFGHHVNPRSKL